MIKNSHILEKFEKEQIIKSKNTYQQNLAIYESLWQEGVTLKVFPLKDPLDGIEKDIEIARILNKCIKK